MPAKTKKPAILLYIDADLKRQVEEMARMDDRSTTSWIIQALKKAVREQAVARL